MLVGDERWWYGRGGGGRVGGNDEVWIGEDGGMGGEVGLQGYP